MEGCISRICFRKEPQIMSNPSQPKAVLYCRVSSPAQVKKGDGLGSQEARCREYSKYRGYEVDRVFREEGVSGGLIDRPSMQTMLKFLRKHKGEGYIVVIDDISRLARGLEAHIKLRSAIGAVGAKLESPSIEFGEDPDSLLVENMMACVSQHHRQKNAEQVKNRMRGRILNGYWTFSKVVGYKYKLIEGQGKMLIRNEPLASVVQEALEGYASGRFSSQSEVKRFLESSPVFPKNEKGGVHFQYVQKILVKSLYAGYLDVPKWSISLQPGKHEPLITFETWQAIQKRMEEEGYAPSRNDVHEDFPLRGFVACAGCGKPVTAGWSKGRNTKYPYYLCQTKGCRDYKKSIRREKIEGEFEKLLHQLRPSKNLFYVATEMFKDLWEERCQKTGLEAKSVESEIKRIEGKVKQFMGRIVKSEDEELITAYETEVRKLQENKTKLKEKIANCGRSLPPFDETYRTAMQFLANPYKLWASDRLEDKRTALNLVFSNRLEYRRNRGYRTAGFSLPFCLIGQLKGSDYQMVELRGIEPLTS